VNVQERFEVLKRRRAQLALFALVDGLLFEEAHGRRLERSAACVALFDGTDDAPLAHAGPWLVDTGRLASLRDELHTREAEAPHVSWIIAAAPFDALVRSLRARLDVRLTDGNVGLLRFYDPRVLYGLATTLSARQREDFFEPVCEWHFTRNGHAMRIGRGDA